MVVLTVDFKEQHVRQRLALVVEGGALVSAAMGSVHLLDDQRLVGHDDAAAQRLLLGSAAAAAAARFISATAAQ